MEIGFGIAYLNRLYYYTRRRMDIYRENDRVRIHNMIMYSILCIYIRIRYIPKYKYLAGVYKRADGDDLCCQ